MSGRWGELVTADKPTVVPKPFLDAIVVEDGQSNGRFTDSAWTDQGDWSEVFSEANDPLDQLVTSETGSRRWGRQFSGRNTMRRWDCGPYGIQDGLSLEMVSICC